MYNYMLCRPNTEEAELALPYYLISGMCVDDIVRQCLQFKLHSKHHKVTFFSLLHESIQ